MQRIVLAIAGFFLAFLAFPVLLWAQSPPAEEDWERVYPLLPPGISDSNIEIYGKLAYTWTMPDGERVIEVQGDFSARMGLHKLTARDGIVWMRTQTWKDKIYLDIEIFLWQGAEIVQPAGSVESGPALLVTLRSFGQLTLNVDSSAAQSDADSALFQEGLKARGLFAVAPPQTIEQSEGPVQVAPTLEKLIASAPKIPKAVQYSAEHTIHEQIGGQSVVIATGEVMVSQGSPSQSGEYLELRADAAVLYLKSDEVSGALPGLIGDEQKDKPKKDKNGLAADQPPLPKKESAGIESASRWVSAVYLEGDVVLMRGQRMIRASRLYYDFDAEKALILDVVTRALEESRNLPIYVRAEQARQLSPTEYEATQAQITTSEFHTPHMALGAGRVYLQDKTPRNERGEIIGVQAGTYKAYNTTLNVEGAPVAYWPFSQGDFSRDRMAFRSAKFGYDSDFGATFETRWYMFNLLGLQQPEGFDATLKADYFTDRGPGVGIDLDYQQENYFGLLRSYYINDQGEDDLGGNRGGPPDTDNRGRGLWRHRQYLPKDWELTIEAAYISDDQYMESFERNEWENGKDQDTALYLVKRQANWQFSTLANWQINDFLTQTEHLPESMFSLIGEPLGNVATAYSESRVGVVRRVVGESGSPNGTSTSNAPDTGSVVRGDTREELTFPTPDLGPVKLTPYIMGRGTAWDDSPDSEGSGGAARAFGAYGLKGNSVFSKVDDSVDSRILDLHRLRHIIKPDFAVWNAHTNQAPEELSPFDSGVEDIDDFGGGQVGLRQKWQTQRGGPGRWRTVDWIVFDVEAGFFNDAQDGERTHGDYIYSRPEESRSSNFLAMNFQYRLSDSTVVVYDGVYDWNRGNMGTSNISLAVEREPRMSYFVGWRYIHDTNNSLVGAGANYKLNEKHTVGIREYYDVELGKNYTTQVTLIRRWPRWYTAVSFDVDKTTDEMSINFSIWPEGSPNMGLGSKRYTGLADSVGVRP